VKILQYRGISMPTQSKSINHSGAAEINQE